MRKNIANIFNWLGSVPGTKFDQFNLQPPAMEWSHDGLPSYLNWIYGEPDATAEFEKRLEFPSMKDFLTKKINF